MEDTVKFVTEHIEVIKLDVADLEGFLVGLGLEHVDEGQSAWQQRLVKSVLEATSQGRHELPICDQIVLSNIELLHVDCGVLLVFHWLLGWRGTTSRHQL